MKTILKKIIPNPILNELRLRKKKHLFSKKDIKETFTFIKETDYWSSNESFSGAGSELNATREVSVQLSKLLTKYKIKYMLDIPCGDFNWMKGVNLQGVKYIGGDIVTSLISTNSHHYGNEDISFVELDITKDQIPQMDLIFCRDCLVHFSFKDIYKALINIKRSNSTYLLTTSFQETYENKNIITGDWRKLNFQHWPFRLTKPIDIIDEKYTKKGNKSGDKSLCLWKIDTLNLPLILKLYYWFT